MLNAPRAAQRPHAITRHGDTRIDPYYWLMGRDDQEVRAHLEAENAYTAEALGAEGPLREAIFEEFKARIEETDISVPVRRRGWWYYDRTLEGLDYPISCRLRVAGDDPTPPTIDPTSPPAGEQILLDENLEAAGHDFLSVGVMAVSPDDRWLAVGVDFEGNELHTVTFRALDGQDGVEDRLENVSYGFTWSSDSAYCFYVRVDAALRPFQLWRHQLGADAATDVLVYEESDGEYNVAIGRSLDGAVLCLTLSSSMTTEIRYLDAHNPTGNFEVVEPRSKGVEYDLEHFSTSDGRHWWIKVTNEMAKDFRALARPRHGGEWREIVPHRPGTRLDGIVAFATFFVLIERFEGFPTLRLAPALTGEDPFGTNLLDHATLISAKEQPASVFLSANAEYETEWLRVQIGSMVTPRYVADVNVNTGDRVIRKRQRVKGDYDPHDYVTGRLWVSASDGVQIPVTVVARRGVLELGEDGQLVATTPAPLLLYGYGSYEASMDPYFSSMRLSLLDRGIIFAVAHVRGGGELGRSWYEMGRLEQKATTFSDFVAVARSLVDLGWTTPDQLAARGGSAGGLLMGAVMNLAPELFRCVVAEVPFVDALTTMLDASLPLTVGEWEEWGNPDASEITYRIMKGYSPYDNVSSTNDDKSPRRYPRLLATCGLNDSRVGFWEAAKWVLRLRDANEANQAFLKVEMGSGHAGPSGRYDSWRDEAYSLAFIASAVNATQRLD